MQVVQVRDDGGLDSVVAVEAVGNGQTPDIILKVESTGFVVVVGKREESRMTPRTGT